ncbi:N-acetyltransferase [Gaiella sp.]|uniref:N-acetyltransferase n=1 Tax=Gaiella sp. TaxID=2663207 RepID=UPI0039833D90
MESARPFVPAGFEPPLRLETPAFVLEPLGPQHNEADYRAWTGSLEHIRATPGFAGRSWPHAMTLAENLADLEMHARHFVERCGFTYTVLERSAGVVVGCVYIYPLGTADADRSSNRTHDDALVRSWVTEAHAGLDRSVWVAVTEWLSREWPFERVAYASRD